MFESFFKAFENFVIEFSPRRLAVALMLAGIGIGGWIILDRYSPYFTIGRLERATAMLEKLSSWDSTSQPSELMELRASIVRQLRDLVEPPPLLGFLAVGEQARLSFWKFAAGFIPWLLFAFCYLPMAKTNPNNWNGIIGAVFLGLAFGFLATVFIPNDWATWKALLVLSIGHFLVAVVAIMSWQARKNALSTLNNG